MCTVTYTDLQKPLALRGRSPFRTNESRDQDYRNFLEKGHGNTDNAKLYNNAIGPALLDIPLDMVKLPQFLTTFD